MPSPPDIQGGVTFTFFCSLLREIAKIPPKRWTDKRASYTHPALAVFQRWLKELDAQFHPLPTGTIAICLRLLFPEEDVRRKYEIQEARLTKYLTDSLGLPQDALKGWSDEDSVGCLGEEVKRALERTCPHPDGFISPVTIAQVDGLLDELASNSSFSHVSIRESFSGRPKRKRKEIITSLFRELSPMDAGFLTQIILKDLRPILYPISELHYSAALRDFKSNAVYMLTKEVVMRTWDTSGWMLRYYRVRCNMAEAATAFELPNYLRPNIAPICGMQVEIPKSKKGLNSIHVLEFLHASSKVWAETKYDGERAQIHVEVVDNGPPKITIFSKSKRDSTGERSAVQSIILEALGFKKYRYWMQDQSSKRIIRNVILDAEMVAFQGEKIDEFWRIRKLVEKTSYGVPGYRRFSRCIPGDDLDVPDNRRLGLVFFDILMLNSASFLQKTYSYRRTILESLIRPMPGVAVLAARYPINMSDQPSNELTRIFAQHIADHEEGLVVKAEESRYNDFKLPWVKFKRDYIEGYGDCVDLVIIGASWEKERGRELRVSPSTYTTFYIGAQTNSKQRMQNPSIRPHFFVHFTVSFGLSRDQLEEVNFLIKNSDHVLYQPSMRHELPYAFTVFSDLSPPRIILKVPLLVELYGAGFTKSVNCEHYELRFPRITKIHRKQERTWHDAIDIDKLNRIAMESAGVKKPGNDIDEWVDNLFGKSNISGLGTPLKRKAICDEWTEKLLSVDQVAASKRGITLQLQSKRRKLVSENSAPVSETLSSSNSQPLCSKTNVTDGFCVATTSAAFSTEFADDIRIVLRASKPENEVQEDTPTSAKSVVNAPRNCQDTVKDAITTKAMFQEGKLVSFVGYSGKCLRCKALKNSVPATKRVHCIDSLLSGCGWDVTINGTKGWISGGIIIVGDHDEAGEEMKKNVLQKSRGVMNALKDIATARRVVWVVGCRAPEEILYRLE